MKFNVIEFLQKYGIYFQYTGKNWIQIECPFCQDHYPWHMGINSKENYFHCFICHTSGKIEYLISKLLKTTHSNAKKIAEDFGGALEFEGTLPTRAGKIRISGLTSLRPLHIRYLESRNYDPQYLVRKYKIGACLTVGRFPYRIVIPVFDNGIIVNATSRDVTGQQQERYLSLSNEESIIPIKETVYNIDSVTGENVLIVEGPFDTWRIGGATVSLFGTAFKMAQVSKILEKSPKNIYIMSDNEEEAQRHAQKLASCFTPFVQHVEILGIPVKDPAMLSAEEAMEIRNELNL